MKFTNKQKHQAASILALSGAMLALYGVLGKHKNTPKGGSLIIGGTVLIIGSILIDNKPLETSNFDGDELLSNATGKETPPKRVVKPTKRYKANAWAKVDGKWVFVNSNGDLEYYR